MQLSCGCAEHRHGDNSLHTNHKGSTSHTSTTVQCVPTNLRAASALVRPCVVDDTSSSTTSSADSTACQGTSSSSLLLSLMRTTVWPSTLLLPGPACMECLAMLIMEAWPAAAAAVAVGPKGVEREQRRQRMRQGRRRGGGAGWQLFIG